MHLDPAIGHVFPPSTGHTPPSAVRLTLIGSTLCRARPLGGGGRQAGRQPVVHGPHLAAAVRVGQIVIVIAPGSAGSVVPNSTTSTTCSFGTSFVKRPWNVSLCAVVLPVPVGASYVSEIRNEPPSRASNPCTWLVMPVGTIQVATARASSSAR
jgi:hypothetical protein